ncbi:MAG: 6-carboxytetrahydropterin synthase [Bacteroidales bacterium]|nr:6-carboxytetrahydropterin synthase [Bacteroidales bacterium]
MAVIRVTKRFSFEMAHALMNYDGLCKNIHGHSYRMNVTIQGMPIEDDESPKKGMVMDFGDLKKITNQVIVSKLDHTLVLNNRHSPQLIEQLRQNFDNILLVPYQPTTENLLADFAQRLQKELPANVKLFSIRLSETYNSFAEWFAEDNR